MGFEEPEGADPVCWLELVCPDCGAMCEGEPPTCWRCSSEKVVTP